MIQLLDKLIDEKQQEVVIVKMDIMTYNNIIEEVEPDEWEIEATKKYEQDKKDGKLEFIDENDFFNLIKNV